jgi:hypothetical protein
MSHASSHHAPFSSPIQIDLTHSPNRTRLSMGKAAQLVNSLCQLSIQRDYEFSAGNYGSLQGLGLAQQRMFIEIYWPQTRAP